LGRRPSANPKDVQVNVRFDAALTKLLDEEAAHEEALRPGIYVTRSDVIRLLVGEAIAARSKKRGKK
jgi:hypothetical protein